MPYLSLRALLVTLTMIASGLLHNLSSQLPAEEIQVNDKSLDFVENKGQLPESIRYKCGLDASTSVYLHKSSLRYVLFEEKNHKHQGHEASACDAPDHDNDHKGCTHGHDHHAQGSPAGHAYEVKFLNAKTENTTQGIEKKEHYLNYIRGNDPSEWVSKVSIFKEVQTQELYEGIALRAHSHEGNFKYDLIVDANADPARVLMEYDGVDEMQLVNGDLIISTSVKEIKELKPYAYQEISGQKIEVPCHYVLDSKNKTVYFSFPEGYDDSKELIIDPTVVCSTLGGTVGGEIFGHTATYDQEGNIYLGGIAYDPGIPITNGAFDATHNGGTTDVVISKFNPIGTRAIYTTFVGGSGTDQPHSLITDNKEQLCIFGISNSDNYPTTSTAFQRNRNGSYDIVLTKLTADGSALVGSTYVGGNQDDGGPSDFTTALYSFTGEDYKGEVVLDNNDYVYVASLSQSPDFPVTPDAIQTEINRTGQRQDAVVFRMSPDLSNMVWSTYLGGPNIDLAKGLRVDKDGDVYVSGTTQSNGIPKTGGGWLPDYPGGSSTAFIAKLANQGRTVRNFTFVGTAGSEDGFLLELDTEGNVYICGISDGTMPATPGAYVSAPRARQFISSFTEDLSEMNYTSLIGSGNTVDFCPVAFMVDKCDFIYISGYETESDLPTTPDAYLPNMTREGFYLAVLDPEGTELSYATYFGDATHVDGGTSRFDPAGIVTQAVCSCEGVGILETTPGAFREEQQARCDMGVFKIDFDRDIVTSAITADQSSSGCPPYSFEFEYSGQDGLTFQWDLGDGTTGTSSELNHTYEFPGEYRIELIAENPNTCNMSDTAYFDVIVLGNTTLIDTLLCDPITPLFLDVTAENANYRWNDGFTGSSLKVEEVGTYWVDISIDGCGQRDSFIVRSHTPQAIYIGEDTTVCNSEFELGIMGQDDYEYWWNTGAEGPDLVVEETGSYALTVFNEFGCPASDTVDVEFIEIQKPDLGPDALLCEGEVLFFDVSADGSSYLWQDGSTDPQLAALTSGTYIVEVAEEHCTQSDTIEVVVTELNVSLPQDTFFCDRADYEITPVFTAVDDFIWSTQETSLSIVVTESGSYEILVFDDLGCESSEVINVEFRNSPDIQLPADTSYCSNENLTIDLPQGQLTHLWQDGSTEASYAVMGSGNYMVTTTLNGCPTINAIEVIQNPAPPLDLGPDLRTCNDPDVQLQLSTSENYDQIAWNDSSDGYTLDVQSDGVYWVEVSNEFGCVERDSIEMTLLYTDPFLQEDITRCEQQEEVQLDFSFIQGNDISWSDGSVGPSFTTAGSGDFWFELNNDGCISRDTFEIIIAQLL